MDCHNRFPILFDVMQSIDHIKVKLLFGFILETPRVLLDYTIMGLFFHNVCYRLACAN